MARKRSTKSTHDTKVRKLATELKANGWKVQADISGFDTPDGIGQSRFIPDISASKGSHTKIIEVDTPNSVNTEQLSSFRRSATHRKNTSFEHIITTPRRKTKRV